MEKVYKVQSYVVKFDTVTPVDISVNVYHENQTQLTREEIIAEALGYLQDLNIQMEENDVFEIETRQKDDEEPIQEEPIQEEEYIDEQEEQLKELAYSMRTRDIVQEGSFIGWDKSENEYYVVKSDTECYVRFWNSSNQQAPKNFPDILDKIRDELIDGDDSGSFSDGWNEIMWEVVYE
jgi:hypothetical protein